MPMSSSDIISRIKKTGETPFEFNIVAHEIDNNIYIPISSLNSLRRNACDALERYILSELERPEISVSHTSTLPVKANNPQISVLVRTEEQLNAAFDSKAQVIYCDILNPQYADIAAKKGKKLYYVLPYISREGYKKYIQALDNTSCQGYIVRSFGIINTSKEIIADYTLNITNSISMNRIREIYGCSTICLSPELNIKELNAIADNNSEIIVYGRLPLMTTHQCPVGLYDGDKGSSKYCHLRNSRDTYYLRDSRNAEFPILRNCKECIAYIMNTSPIHTLDKYRDILSIGAGRHRIELSTEDYNTSLEIINKYIDGGSMSIDNATKGHYYRGVE